MKKLISLLLASMMLAGVLAPAAYAEEAALAEEADSIEAAAPTALALPEEASTPETADAAPVPTAEPEPTATPEIVEESEKAEAVYYGASGTTFSCGFSGDPEDCPWLVKGTVLTFTDPYVTLNGVTQPLYEAGGTYTAEIYVGHGTSDVNKVPMENAADYFKLSQSEDGDLTVEVLAAPPIYDYEAEKEYTYSCMVTFSVYGHTAELSCFFSKDRSEMNMWGDDGFRVTTMSGAAGKYTYPYSLYSLFGGGKLLPAAGSPSKVNVSLITDNKTVGAKENSIHATLDTTAGTITIELSEDIITESDQQAKLWISGYAGNYYFYSEYNITLLAPGITPKDESYTVLKNDTGTYLLGAMIGTDAQTLLSKLSGSNMKVKTSNGVSLNSDALVGTGNTITNGMTSLIVVVRGDVNGDADVNLTDALEIMYKCLRLREIDGAYLEAAKLKTTEGAQLGDVLEIMYYKLRIPTNLVENAA